MRHHALLISKTAIAASASNQYQQLNSQRNKFVPNTLQGKTIEILANDSFEQVELTKPRKALEEAGARAQVVSPTDKKIKGWDKKDWGEEVQVDVPLKSANPAQYRALLLPGGIMNPDHLRMNPDAVKFVKHFF